MSAIAERKAGIQATIDRSLLEVSESTSKFTRTVVYSHLHTLKAFYFAYEVDSAHLKKSEPSSKRVIAKVNLTATE